MIFRQSQNIHFCIDEDLNLSLFYASFLDIFIVMRRYDKQEITAELKSSRKDFKAMNVFRDHYLSSTIQLTLLLKEMHHKPPHFIPVLHKCIPTQVQHMPAGTTLRLRRVGRAAPELRDLPHSPSSDRNVSLLFTPGSAGKWIALNIQQHYSFSLSA